MCVVCGVRDVVCGVWCVWERGGGEEVEALLWIPYQPPPTPTAITTTDTLYQFHPLSPAFFSTRCMQIAGVRMIRSIPGRAETNFEFDAVALEQAIEADIQAGLIPFFISATIGTTSSGACDDITRIGGVAKKYNVWLHVDSAYAGPAAVCEEYRGVFAGRELCDSFNFNAHKWMLTNFDCSVLWVQNRTHLLDALSITPEYMRNKASESGLVVDYRDWQIPLGRRFRALKLWFVMRSFGAEGIRQHIQDGIELARYFEEELKKDGRFEIPVPRSFGLVCFRLKGKGNEANQALLDAVNATKKTFIIHTALEGKTTLRFAAGGVMSEKEHVDNVLSLLKDSAASIV
uniref:Aromatic-L-amino-acid decarboxylase n=1 Tax=Palpitomonas bilix TaxID=652834 RepID=A0A7S3LUL0_9EUKA|mmetsp:Transcript_47694/g.123665  ORF Transcript_47694/g.123665 Transcript_47694/m.123665 type:complete len:346 (+) Transcript_47694:801-1838(+)